MRADCGKCVYFIKFSELSISQQEDALSKAHLMGRDPSRVLGWCVKKQIPITHYRGYCRDYESKKTFRKQLTLTGGVAWVEG